MTEPPAPRRNLTIWQAARELALALLRALFLMPLCVLAPFGVAQFLGWRITNENALVVLLVTGVFVVGMAAYLFSRALQGRPADAGSIIDAATEKVGRGCALAGGCLLWLLGIAAVIFVVGGIFGVLLFGFRQLFY